MIEFPGRLRLAVEKLGPIVQQGELDGEVIQIGGKDETINVHIKIGDQIHICVSSKAIARRLAQHLFGSPVRVRGSGTWGREGEGVWKLRKFEIASFESLDETPISKVFTDLRAQLVPPTEGRINPVELMRQLREE